MVQEQTAKSSHLVTVVITVPFSPRFESFVRVLDLVVSLMPEYRIIIVLEEKMDQDTKQQIQDVAKHHEILLCDEFETAGRWYRGIRRAFDGHCEKILMLPGDMEKVADEEMFKNGLINMVGVTNDKCLTVGDFTSADLFKEQFDPLFSHQMLASMFPETWPAIEQVGIRKLRSEYFCIGAKAFQAFQRQGWRWLPLDATMLLILAVVIDRECELRRVYLGEVSDSPTRRIDTAIQQILRFGFHVWFNGHRLAGRTVEDQTKLLTDKWWPIIHKAMADLLPIVET
jgi:hypothetical protein